MATVIALFIDYENVHYGLVNQYNFKPTVPNLISAILTEVGKSGNILIKKAYADWEKPEFLGVQASLKRAGVEPAYTLSKKTNRAGVESTWKDSADAVLLLDAQQTMYEREDVLEFVLVTGDRAALDLVHRLTSRGKTVRICALESALAQELTDSVNGEVISIEKLLGIEPVVSRKPVIAASVYDAGKPNWEKIILWLDSMEKSMAFVACSIAKSKYGITQEVLTIGKTTGIIEIFQVPNPNNALRPTSAMRLKRDSKAVIEALSKKP
jgi:uncharacterized LabA/DUF88 family protein